MPPQGRHLPALLRCLLLCSILCITIRNPPPALNDVERKHVLNLPLTLAHSVAPRSDNPCILDYIKIKHDVAELEKQAADWRRKIDILNMERNRTRQLLRSITGATGALGAGTGTGGAGTSVAGTSSGALQSARSMRQGSKVGL